MAVGSPVVAAVVVSYIPHIGRVVEVCCSGWAGMFDGFFPLDGMGLV